MYRIIEKNDGQFLCLCGIQDGTERWLEKDRQLAEEELIKAARVLNGMYITRQDIKYEYEMCCKPNPQDKLLQAIQSGEKVVLDFNDKRIKYHITEEECEMILGIREGKYDVSERYI